MLETLRQLPNSIDSRIKEFAFKNSQGVILLERWLEKPIDEILLMPDFEFVRRALSTTDLHVHPLYIYKKNGKIKIYSIDNELELPDKIIRNEEMTLDIATKTWDRSISQTLRAIELTIRANDQRVWANFGKGRSYSTVASDDQNIKMLPTHF
jgi:hypothetical protein